jgi:FG-GAP repeat
MNRHGTQILSRALFLLAVIFPGFLMLMPQPASAQSYVFGRADFPVPGLAYGMVSGDFNGDGIPDFAVLNTQPTGMD